MSVFALPNKRLFRPRRWTAKLLGAYDSNVSPVNGAADIVDLIGDGMLWIFEYGNNYTIAERDEQRGFWSRFRGGSDLVRAWPPARPEPRGTLRGTPTASAAGVGSMTLTVNGSMGATLETGDFLEVPFADGTWQLIEIHAASGTGTIACALTAPLRKAVANGAPLTWLRPSALFRVPNPPEIPHEPKVSGNFTVELEEWIE